MISNLIWGNQKIIIHPGMTINNLTKKQFFRHLTFLKNLLIHSMSKPFQSDGHRSVRRTKLLGKPETIVLLLFMAIVFPHYSLGEGAY